ncbi:MAG: MFS transporter [Desulfatiglandales bacterium]
MKNSKGPWRWFVLAIATSNFFLSQFYRASNAVIAPHLIRDLELTTETLGLLSACFFYAFALTQIPIGMFLDRIGPRKMMTGLSIVGIAGALVFSVADSLTLGILGRILLGVGMACNLMGSFKLLTTWFGPRSFATLSGLVFSIGTLGNMFAATPLVLLVDEIGWRGAYQLIAGSNFIIILSFYILVRDRPGNGTAEVRSNEVRRGFGRIFSDLALLFRKKDYWIIAFGTFASSGVFLSFQNLWVGPFLMDAMGFSAVRAGNVILSLNIGLILGGPVMGALSDRVFRTRKWVILWGHVGVCLIVFLMSMLSPGYGYALFCGLFFGFGLFRGTGLLMYPHIKDLMPLEMAGTAMTAINFFTMTGSAVFLQGLGSLMERLYPQASRGPEAFRAAFFVCSAFLIALVLLYAFARDKSHRTS